MLKREQFERESVECSYLRCEQFPASLGIHVLVTQASALNPGVETNPMGVRVGDQLELGRCLLVL